MLGFVGVARGDRGGADEDAHVMRFALLDDAADGVEVFLLMLGVGFGAPADVVDAVGDSEDGCAAVEDVFLQARQAAGGGVAAPASVDESDLRAG